MNAHPRRISRFRYLLFVALAYTCSAIACSAPNSDELLLTTSAKPAPIARQGVLDLRDWNFATDGPVTMSGEWEVYEGQLLAPGDFNTRANQKPRGMAYAEVPGNWGTGNGYMTYRVRVLLPNDANHLIAQIFEAGTAYEFYWDDLLLAQNGRVGHDPETHRSQFLPLLRDIPVAENTREPRSVEIIVRISDFAGRLGGFHKAILLGNSGDILLAHARSRVIEAFLVGALLVMGLYHLAIWLRRKRENTAFWFGAYCVVISLRLLVTGSRPLQSAFPDLPFFIYYRVEYLTFYAAVLIFATFTQRLFPRQFPAVVLRGMAWIAIPMCAAVIVLPIAWYTKTLTAYQLFTVAAGVFALIIFIRAAIIGEPGARLILFGFGVLFATAINDMIYARYAVGPGYLVPAGLFVFIFAQAGALSRRIATAFNTSEELSATLEHKVAQRTIDLQEAQRAAEESRAEVLRLNEFSKKLNAATDLDIVVTDISRFAVESLQMRGAFLTLVDSEKEELFSAGGYLPGATEEQTHYLRTARLPLGPESGFLYLTYKRAKTAYLRGLKKIETKTDREIRDLFGITSFVHIPLIVRDEVHGIMGFSPGDRQLTRQDLARLEAYVDQIAGAVYTAGLLKSVQNERAIAVNVRRETESLNQLLKRIAPLDDIQAIMKAVMDFVRRIHGLQFYSLYTVDVARRQIDFASGNFPDGLSEIDRARITDTPIPIDHPTGAFSRAYARRKLTYFPRLYRNLAATEEQFVIDSVGLKNFVICPLMAEDELVAFLNFTTHNHDGLTRQQLNWLSILSEQIAGVIRANKLMQAVKKEQARAETARQESDRLLNNVLPATVAEELKREGQVTPLFYDSVSVMFTDFVGFTEASQQMRPEELVKELDGCFSQFDAVVERNAMEKLKTIGDAYMCAGGLPGPNETHAIDACLAALELRAFMAQMAEVKIALGHDYWRIRIGIHSGPVTAGVIGTNKFAYDIWGDTVNTASRMESAGEPGEINVSEGTYALVRDLFDFESRGQVQAKGKGLLEMYFLRRIRPELSVDDDGLVPNARFEILRAERGGASKNGSTVRAGARPFHDEQHSSHVRAGW